MNFTDVDHTVWITTHALDRLAEHFEGINARSARGMVNRALEVDAGSILPVLGRRSQKPGARPSRYFLVESRSGVMVIEPELGTRPNNMPWVVVTYLRLEQSQQDLVNRLWPKAAA